MTIAETILKSKGPMISSRLVKLLAAKSKTEINTASQQVSRNKKILKIKGFYASQQSFCYLEEHIESDFFSILF